MQDNNSPAGAAPIDSEGQQAPAIYAGHAEALREIQAGRAEAFALWVLLSQESERDGYALKPMPWEGPGEYQHVKFNDGREGFVRVPFNRSHLPTSSRFKVRVQSAPDADVEPLRAALREIETICTESASDCRKRMGTRVGNCLTVARAAIAKAEGA